MSPNALYSHVVSKTTLVDDVLAGVEAPVPDVEDPSAGLHDVMASTYRVLLAHPDLVPLYLARQGARGPNAQRLGDIMLRLLDGAVLSGPRAREARRVLIVYTIGFAAFTTRPPIDADADPLFSIAGLQGAIPLGQVEPDEPAVCGGRVAVRSARRPPCVVPS